MAKNVSTVAALLLAAVLPAAAGGPAELPPVLGATELFARHDRSGVGLSGFDPVSYFAGEPRPGRADLELVWAGLAWRFSSAANREAFRRDPAVYAPRLGAYDAAAAADGRLVEADPTRFALVAGRLYLFRDAAGQRRFVAEPALAAAAEKRWPDLSRELVKP